jgi:DNA repair exonuclease SbcCD ATPase subunit
MLKLLVYVYNTRPGYDLKSKMLYIRTYRDETLKDLHRKIDDLQRNNDHWKNKAKDLERRMLELTVLQQKHEKRKAKTAALRVPNAGQ